MKRLYVCLLVALCFATALAQGRVNTYKADNPYLNYVGRIDFKDPARPRFRNPGVYVQARFIGTSLSIDVNDEVLYGKVHNYIDVAIDNLAPVRMKTTGKTNHITIARMLPAGVHTVTICKDTEASLGYLEFTALTCTKLLPWINHSLRKIEFIGNSITCGSAADESAMPCGKGEWYDQHNAYMAYGPRTARKLGAQWQLTSYSGIGLVHSCCNITFTMPNIYQRLNLTHDTARWDFKRYLPDVVTICLGQNDGVQDSVMFCGAYVSFLQNIRKLYPAANMVLLNSPMADARLNKVLENYIRAVETVLQEHGDDKVSHYFFKHSYHNGCGMHPSINQHGLIAVELTAYLKKLKGW